MSIIRCSLPRRHGNRSTALQRGLRYHTASVCIPPSFVRRAAAYLGGRLPVCTVVGFPNGYHAAAVKAFEAVRAVEDGAGEIDMVIDIGAVKEGRFADTAAEIAAVRSACPGKILKVIVETCLLAQEEKLAHGNRLRVRRRLH